MEELIAKRYAKALSEATKNVQTLVAKLDVISEALSSKEVSDILVSPMIDSSKKTDMILSVLKGDRDKILKNFIKVLGEKKRLELIPAITKVLNADIQKEANVYEGVLKSSSELKSKEIKELEQTLSKYTGATIKLTQENSDLDGLRVSVDDLGIEVNFSKDRVKEQLIDFIKKSL
jgi:F-type H+-transporting ATPase subunit delta